MGWLSAYGEFMGSAFGAYRRTKTKLEIKDPKLGDPSCPDQTKVFLTKSLSDCQPSTDQLTSRGISSLKKSLEKNDYFGALLAIDSNTQVSKRRAICILTLKTAAYCICHGYTNEDFLRSVTYSYLAQKYMD
jgi:hypothetical protein